MKTAMLSELRTLRARNAELTRNANIYAQEIDLLERRNACIPEMVAALKAAELELEANKVAMIGPEWAAQRTATGGALLQVFRALSRAKEGRAEG